MRVDRVHLSSTHRLTFYSVQFAQEVTVVSENHSDELGWVVDGSLTIPTMIFNQFQLWNNGGYSTRTPIGEGVMERLSLWEPPPSVREIFRQRDEYRTPLRNNQLAVVRDEEFNSIVWNLPNRFEQQQQIESPVSPSLFPSTSVGVGGGGGDDGDDDDAAGTILRTPENTERISHHSTPVPNRRRRRLLHNEDDDDDDDDVNEILPIPKCRKRVLFTEVEEEEEDDDNEEDEEDHGDTFLEGSVQYRDNNDDDDDGNDDDYRIVPVNNY